MICDFFAVLLLEHKVRIACNSDVGQIYNRAVSAVLVIAFGRVMLTEYRKDRYQYNRRNKSR